MEVLTQFQLFCLPAVTSLIHALLLPSYDSSFPSLSLSRLPGEHLTSRPTDRLLTLHHRRGFLLYPVIIDLLTSSANITWHHLCAPFISRDCNVYLRLSRASFVIRIVNIPGIFRCIITLTFVLLGLNRRLCPRSIFSYLCSCWPAHCSWPNPLATLRLCTVRLRCAHTLIIYLTVYAIRAADLSFC